MKPKREDPRIVVYKRAPETRTQVAPYEQKFAGLIACCKKAKAEGISNLVVACPWVIGDTYDELIESLSRIADAGLVLHVVERFKEDKPPAPDVGLN